MSVHKIFFTNSYLDFKYRYYQEIKEDYYEIQNFIQEKYSPI
jgi:hypothetical protein